MPAKKFLEHLFRGAPADSCITITAPQNDAWLSRHASVTDLEAAAESARLADEEGLDAYFGLGARRSDLDQYHRGACADLVGFGCLWLDIDVGTRGHASKTLPPDDDAAAGLLDALPLAPSLVVSSGGGYHAYWLFDRWCADVRRVAALCGAWQRIAVGEAAMRGWHVDDTSDVVRVLRVPGTHNYKVGEPRPVVLECPDEPTRYSIEDLESRVKLPAPVAVSPTSSEPIDLAALRARLSEARRSKAHGDARQKAQAEILGRVLDGEPLAESGERDNTLISAMGLVAYWLPASTPWEAALEVLRPSLSKMDVQPEGLDHWIEESRKKYIRQAQSRIEADAKKAAEAERFREIAKAVSNRAAPTAEEIAEAGGEWKDQLIEGKDGPRACEHNARLILACAPETKGTIRWNDVGKVIEVRGGPLAGVPAATLHTAAAGWLQANYDLMCGAKLAGAALLQVARENSYDPIAEYLGELAWDGISRIDDFLISRCGAVTLNTSEENIEAHLRRVSRKWFIGLVARALNPGCQLDTVLVLEGAQGIRKSSLLRALGGEWYCETEINLEDKDARLLISTAWIVELAELTSLVKGRYKGFVTAPTDKFRPPYGAAVETFPRRAVLVGTGNDETYLDDPTGLRRFWPVRLADRDIDVDAIDRDQLLAEAVVAFRAGEKWWLDRAEAQVAETQAQERAREPKYRDLVWAWWCELPDAPPKANAEASYKGAWLSTDDIASEALKLAPDRVDGAVRRDVGYAVRALGFERKQKSSDGARSWRYRATDAMVREHSKLKLVP